MNEIIIDLFYICHLAGYVRNNKGDLFLPPKQEVIDEIKNITERYINELISQLTNKENITGVLTNKVDYSLFELIILGILVKKVPRVIRRATWHQDVIVFEQ